MVDAHGSFIAYRKGRDELIASVLDAHPQEVTA
jgi:hypothetical protein